MTRKLLVADLLCGAGGSSTGCARALAALGLEMELVCVNHSPVAIETHRRNHPQARHYVEDIAAVRPHLIVPEGRLDLLMASPTCTHHSVARGGKPTSDQQRSDPWHIITWFTELRVKRAIIENVWEFTSWGPVDARTGRPIKSRRGEYFRAWVDTIRRLGATAVEWRKLNAADYGDATTRQRFIMMVRFDGRPIAWPVPTHRRVDRNAGAELALFPTVRPWRPAGEIIDWSINGRSIFARKKPLAPKTLARIHAGAVRFGWPEPYLVILRNHMAAQGLDRPLPAITAGGTHLGLAQPVPFILSRQGGGAPRGIDAPTPTQCTNHSHVLISPYYGSGSGETCRPASEPLPTVTAKARFGMVVPITHSGGANRARDVDSDPLPTLTTANRGELAFITASHGERRGQPPRVHGVEAPVPTIAAQGHVDLVEAAMSESDGSPRHDILFRMLEPHELAAAMGFNAGGAHYQFAGTKTEQIRQIGNAVSVAKMAACVGAIMADAVPKQTASRPAEAARGHTAERG